MDGPAARVQLRVRALAPLAAAALVLATASAVPGSRGREGVAPTPEARDCCPAVSPDGTTIAFVRDPIGPSATFVVTTGIDGAGETALARGELDAPAWDLRWSPDGTRLAFTSNYRLFVVGLDGTGMRRIGPGFEYAWSPDGTRLAVNAEHFGGPIVLYSATGRKLRTLTRGADSAPAWSRDGRWIAFVRSAGREGRGKRGSGLYVVPSGGGRPRRVASDAGLGGGGGGGGGGGVGGG
jgi:Tol biopolymer transport system component